MTTEHVLILAAAGLVTWMLRASFIAWGSELSLTEFGDHLLENMRHATMAALVAGALVAGGGGDIGDIPWRWAAAALATATAATRTRNLALLVLTGMGSLWVLTLAATVS
jgi:branched-subunit amino acid transport protein